MTYLPLFSSTGDQWRTTDRLSLKSGLADKSIICFEFISEMLVRIPGNVPVGQWSVTVATWYGEKSMNESRHDMETFHATSNDPFYVLFNPFSECKECIC